MKRNAVLCALLALLLVCLAGCGRAATADMKSYAPVETRAGDYQYSSTSDYVLHEAARYGSVSSPDTPSASDSQKLIRRVQLTAETEDYTAFMGGLTDRINELGGYVEGLDAYTSGSEPSADLTIRIPADRLDALVKHIDGASNVTWRSESQENVTLQYVDTESRIKALRTEEERLLELLKGAESLSDILQIEDRLGQVRYELESAESSLRALANKVDYATVSLSVRQVKTYTPTQEEGFWSKLGSGFVSSAEGAWGFLKDLFRLFVVSIPYLLLIGGIALLICLPLCKWKKRKKGRAAKQASAPQAPAYEAPTEPQQRI